MSEPNEHVDALTPDDTGRWLVTTQGSSHIWDLDAMTYTRIPGPTSGSGGFPQDCVANPITRVERWPRVGEVFLVWFDDAEFPRYVEQWRQSSIVRSIERLEDSETSTLRPDQVRVANGILGSVHPASACDGQPWGCWVHAPRDHPLAHARILWREDKGTAERVCEHGIGHPEPQDAAYWWNVHGRDVTVHGCDGCCRPLPKWTEGLLP